MTHLDDPSLLALDKAGMLGHIASLGHELWRAWLASDEVVIPGGAAKARSVVLAGMGGSATASDYVAAICGESAELPVTTCRGYALPNYVSERTLVVVSSYSGNTEEALSLYDDAWKRGAPILCLTSGGRLAERAANDSVPVFRITYKSAPRAAMAHGLAPLLRVCDRLGLARVTDDDVKLAADDHARLTSIDLAPSSPVAENRAKQAAELLHRRIPIVLGSEQFAAVAQRFRNQLSENGKVLASADSIPEAAHNLVVGLGTASDVRDHVALLAIESRVTGDRRAVVQMDGLCQQFEECGIPAFRIDLGDGPLLRQFMLGTAWGDYTSFYLGLLNGQDPTPIPQIERLKSAPATQPV